MATLRRTIRDRIAANTTIMSPSPGLGFLAVYDKWLRGSGSGSEPNAFDAKGAIKPAIVVWGSTANAHPSPHVPGWTKQDTLPSIYLYQYPSEDGRNKCALAAAELDRWLSDPTWQPVIAGGARPVFQWDGETEIDNDEQFPGNYVLVVRFRVTTARAVPV